MSRPKMIVGITGASGIVYGTHILQALHALDVETHLILTRGARRALPSEMTLTATDIQAMADVVHHPEDLGAAIASGSFHTMGMVVAPCSVKTVAQIAAGICDELLPRAAEVTLKERRPLVLMVRETPFTRIHLRNMMTVTESGGIIAPPVPAFYTNPTTLQDIVTHTVGRVLDLFGLDTGNPRWGEGIPTSAVEAEVSGAHQAHQPRVSSAGWSN